MSMSIPPEQIKYSRKVGTLEGKPVFEVGTIGGLHLIIATRKGKTETLGVGPHRAVARHIAKKREPDFILTDLAKGDDCPEESFSTLLPKYEQITKAMRGLQDLE